MKVNKIEYVILKRQKTFSEISDGEYFSGGGHLYMKILKGDLQYFEINSVNAFNVFQGGLNHFNDDEEFNVVILEKN